MKERAKNELKSKLSGKRRANRYAAVTLAASIATVALVQLVPGGQKTQSQPFRTIRQPQTAKRARSPRGDPCYEASRAD